MIESLRDGKFRIALDNGHETLYNEAGGWKDESEFAAKAVVIANERLKTDLREQMRHSDMTMFTCSTCGKKWPENYCVTVHSLGAQRSEGLIGMN